MLIMHKLYEASSSNTDIRDRLALVVLNARTHRLSTNKGVANIVATREGDGKKND